MTEVVRSCLSAPSLRRSESCTEVEARTIRLSFAGTFESGPCTLGIEGREGNQLSQNIHYGHVHRNYYSFFQRSQPVAMPDLAINSRISAGVAR
jgi:hypothetical protein